MVGKKEKMFNKILAATDLITVCDAPVLTAQNFSYFT
jgi:hypothetical protein